MQLGGLEGNVPSGGDGRDEGFGFPVIGFYPQALGVAGLPIDVPVGGGSVRVVG